MCRSDSHGGRRCPVESSVEYRRSRAEYQRTRYTQRTEIVKRVEQTDGIEISREDAVTYARHVMRIETRLAAAEQKGLETEQMYSHVIEVNGGEYRDWLPSRSRQHKEIIKRLMEKYENVPREHQALMSGGLGGAGKGFVLKNHSPYDSSAYATVNPDDIKEVMADMDMIPQVEGLSPMEASPLVHEEASYLSKRLASALMWKGTNIVYDITMSSDASTRTKMNQLLDRGYEVDAVFVDIDPDESIKRAQKRHLSGYLRHKDGIGDGGRWLPPTVTERQKLNDSIKAYRSINSKVFDNLTKENAFRSYAIFDNNVTGRAPERLDSVEKIDGWN